MATKLSIYNDALQILKERKLSSETEARGSRRKLDTAWDAGLVKSILEDYDWICFRRAERLDYDVNAPEVNWGYKYVFDFPAELAKLSGVWSDEYMTSPNNNHRVEGRTIYSANQELFITFVPDDTVVEAEIASWPTYFERYVAAKLAYDAGGSITSDSDMAGVMGKLDERKRLAESKDAMTGPTLPLPTGRWVAARGTSRLRNRDGRP